MNSHIFVHDPNKEDQCFICGAEYWILDRGHVFKEHPFKLIDENKLRWTMQFAWDNSIQCRENKYWHFQWE